MPERLRSFPSPAPWMPDVLAVVTCIVGSVIVVVTGDPGWIFLSVIACVLLPVGQRDSRVAITVSVLAGVGWLIGLAVFVANASTVKLEIITQAWGRPLLALLVVVAVSRVSHHRWRRMHQERDDARSFAEKAVAHDPLTGLANRRGLEMLGTQILESARRRGDAVYCIFLDVDGLAQVNIEMGRSAGDDVLLTVAEALTGSTRATDAVSRWGDDEFVVVGPGTGLAPLEMERRVRAHCLEKSPVARAVWPARISAGGAVLEPWNEGDIDSLLREADREMQLRRTLRRESGATPYQPVQHDPSPRPPKPRR